MSKLTVESIIRIYGSKVKEVKVFNEKKRAQAENFLQIEPVAFALADEPDVLRIYVDKESAEASLDGTLQNRERKKPRKSRRKKQRTAGRKPLREHRNLYITSQTSCYRKKKQATGKKRK